MSRVIRISLALATATALTLASGAGADGCGCPADFNGDSIVDGPDLAVVLGSWGSLPPSPPTADLNDDGMIDGIDLGLLLEAWGECPAPPSPVVEPQVIEQLAKDAYVWGLPLEFVYRFGRYNALLSAEFNTLAYVPAPAQWDNRSTNAGNASVLYIFGSLDLSGDRALVFTVPASPEHYIVVQIMDAFINTFANPGSRTSGAETEVSYLMVGPDSPYAGLQFATIDGHEFPVIACDTSRGQLLARVLANTLLPSDDPDSAYAVMQSIGHGILLNTLEEFQAAGNQPQPPASYAIKVPTDEERAEAELWQNSPLEAVEFFGQMGAALRLNQLPTASTGLSGTPISKLPAYIVPQPGAGATYMAPSVGQQAALTLFHPIGLSQSGFRVPCNWGKAQLEALQAGFEAGIALVQSNLNSPVTAATNWWKYKNSKWGTYENTIDGFLTRAAGVIAGGFPSLVEDGLYAVHVLEAGSDQPLDGNASYAMTFAVGDGTLPADGTLPPLELQESDGPPVGFWSLTVYQPGQGEAACPCLSQASVLNTHYSVTDTDVVAIDARADTILAEIPVGPPIEAGTAILFDDSADDYGLEPRVAYFVVSDPVERGGRLEFRVSAIWRQRLSTAAGDPGTPVQGSGEAGPVVDLIRGSSPLRYGRVMPVAQLGSSQVESGQLRQNLDENGAEDGTYTIWLAPTLPEGAFVENWIPTPSTDYLQSIYPDATELNTEIWPMFRVYAAQPGSMPPSILPCRDCTGRETVGGSAKATDDAMLATYRFPNVERLTAP